MKLARGREIALASFVYLAALGLANANEFQCVEKAKEAARKMYGNCLADYKTNQLQELRKAYQNELMQLRKKHEQEVAALKAERAELRRGIIKTKKLQESNTLSGSSLENINSSSSKTGSSEIANSKEVTATNVTEPQIFLKNAEGTKVEISPLEDANSVDLPEPETIQ
jgi:uncharacterized protein YecT (DUF1311 family)